MAQTAAASPRTGISARQISLRGFVGLAIALLALVVPPAARAADEGFRTWLAAFWKDAEEFGISRETFNSAFRGVEPDLSLPDLVVPGRQRAPRRGQAEFTRPPQDYISKSQIIRLSETGRALKAKYASELAKIEREIGVEAEAILAIWGRETAFGTYRLPHYAIEA